MLELVWMTLTYVDGTNADSDDGDHTSKQSSERLLKAVRRWGR